MASTANPNTGMPQMRRLTQLTPGRMDEAEQLVRAAIDAA
jgi:hypothetical protein